jgi:hypothetical protein
MLPLIYCNVWERLSEYIKCAKGMLFNKGRTNVHDEQYGCPSLIEDYEK